MPDGAVARPLAIGDGGFRSVGRDAMSTDATVAPAPADRLFFGHPRGLAFLIFAESWERFSFYGMQALLVLYMGQQLFLPGHIEHVAGFSQFRAAIESVYGPLTPVALASAIFGLYAGGVYLTPIAGGFIADRLLGRTRTITIGAIVMAIGHFLMAFEVSFLGALACLLVGVGMFKGNIASQVGELYAPGDLRRADAFQLYLIGISVAVIISPLVCGTLGQKVAWHWGFGAAGVGMLLGLAVYLAGRRWLPPDTIRKRAAPGAPRPRLAPGEGRTIAVLVALIPVLAISAVGNQQIFNSYEVWGDAHYALTFFGHAMPVTWLISFDAIVSTVMLIGSVAFWRWWATRRREPDEIVKLAIGAAVAAIAPLVLALASSREAETGHRIGLGWALGFHLFNDIGFANLFPVGLALFSRASPRAVAGLMIGVYYLSLFAANMTVGWLGGLLDKMPSSQFWLIHAGLIGLSAILLLAFAKAFGHVLAPTVDPEAVN
jgi:POT family proton-dependent oligopeptide transporter